jgi:uncharacterized protein YndB with AHSA1/START domain
MYIVIEIFSTGEIMSQVFEAKAAMLVRKPADEVFEAMVNPEITSRFWFTKSSGRVEEGKILEWTWEMFDFSLQVTVKKVQENRLISWAWPGAEGQDDGVEITFAPHADHTTFVSIVEKGTIADEVNLVDKVAGQTAGWTMVLSALKALLEHNIILTVVRDRFPDGLEMV